MLAKPGWGSGGDAIVAGGWGAVGPTGATMAPAPFSEEVVGGCWRGLGWLLLCFSGWPGGRELGWLLPAPGWLDGLMLPLAGEWALLFIVAGLREETEGWDVLG